MYPIAEFRREKRLRWFGHVQRRDKYDATRKILQMEVDGKRNRGRPKLRWRDLVKDDMDRNQMTTEMAGVVYRQVIITIFRMPIYPMLNQCQWPRILASDWTRAIKLGMNIDENILRMPIYLMLKQ